MGILLFLLGLLAAASGGLKLRSRVRSLLGVSPLAVVETAVGVLTVLGSGAGLGRVRPLAWAVVVVAAGLIAVSSTAHVRSMLQRREKREASEAERLGSFLQS
jgi:Kef-type K+ transport system membrane component KefB